MLDELKWNMRLRRMISILEEDRRLLLRGETDRLIKLEKRRSDSEKDLMEIPGTIAERHKNDLLRIQTLAKRNHRLLQAYMQGAKSAIDRLIQIEKSQGDIGAYGRNGAKVSPQSSPTRFRRA